MAKNEAEYIVTFIDGYKYTALENSKAEAFKAARIAYPGVAVQHISEVED